MRSDGMIEPIVGHVTGFRDGKVIHAAKACASFVFPDPDNPVRIVKRFVRRLATNRVSIA